MRVFGTRKWPIKTKISPHMLENFLHREMEGNSKKLSSPNIQSIRYFSSHGFEAAKTRNERISYSFFFFFTTLLTPHLFLVDFNNKLELCHNDILEACAKT